MFKSTRAGGRRRYDLLKSFPTLYEYLITTVETMLMKELMMEYVTTRLMHKISNCKENEPQGENMVVVSCQSKADDSPSRQGVKMCFYCIKCGHIAQIRYTTRTKRRRMLTMRTARTNSHLQRNMEHIRGALVNGSWIRKPQNT